MGGTTIRDRITGLRRVRAGDLVANPRNWRTHPKAQGDALRGLLEEIGWADALIARELDDGRLELIDGHLRKEIDADAQVPVLVLDVDQAEADKVLATLDPLASLAGANGEAVHALAERVTSDSEAVRALLDRVFASARQRQLFDDEPPTPALPAKPRTKPGDVWVMGDHRLVCGSSGDPATVLRATQDQPVDLLVTSPPYNCGIDYGEHHDGLPRGRYLALLESVMKACVPTLAKGRFVAWVVGVTPKTRHFDHARLLEESGLAFYRQIVWAKAGVSFPIWQYTDGKARKYHPNYTHELIYLFSNGKPKPGRRTAVIDDYSRDVWHVHQSQATRDMPGVTNARKRRVDGHGGSKAAAHPAAYPIGIPVGAIAHLTAPRERVLDPFCGSGTTILACERMKRIGVAIDVDPAYCDLAVYRWEALTGRKAKRVARPKRRKAKARKR